MKAWRVEQHGGPEVLELEDVSLRPLETDEARIRIQAVALNHLDLWVRKGVPGHRFPLPLTLGCDFSGEVCELGPLTDKTEEWLNRHHIEEQTSVVVDPVLSCGKCTVCEAGNTALCKEFGLLGETTDGGLSGYANVPIKNLVVKPQNLTYAEAASLPIAYVTAWNMLVHKAEAKKGDIVFIRAAGSGVSAAATQIAKYLGCHVITTVGQNFKSTLAKGLGADLVVQYQKQDVVKETKEFVRKLGKRGVDIALDHVGKETFLESLKLLDWGGRLVFCGATTGSQVTLDLKPLFFKNISVLGSTMGKKEDLQKLVDLAAAQRLRPVIDSQYDFEQVPEAMEHLESRQAFGKVLVSVGKPYW